METLINEISDRLNILNLSIEDIDLSEKIILIAINSVENFIKSEINPFIDFSIIKDIFINIVIGEYLSFIKISNIQNDISLDDAIKTINPGYKKVYRFYDKKTGYALGDVLVLANELIPKDQYTLIDPNNEWKQTTITDYSVKELQVPIFIDGIQVYDVPEAVISKQYCEQDFQTIYPEIKRSSNPHGYYVDLSKKLLKLKKDLINQAVTQGGKQLVKCEKKN